MAMLCRWYYLGGGCSISTLTSLISGPIVAINVLSTTSKICKLYLGSFPAQNDTLSSTSFNVPRERAVMLC